MSAILFLPKTSAFVAKPKSATLYIFFFTKIFAGLTSLCIYPLPTKTLNPYIILLNAPIDYC